MTARRDSWWGESARAHRDGCRCGSRVAPARPPSPARPANPRPSVPRRTAACAAGPAGDRYTGSWDVLPADRPARRFAAARKYRSVVWPWPFPRKVLPIVLTCRASGVLALDLVFQHSDFFDVKFDSIAMLEKPAELNSAAIADRA